MIWFRGFKGLKQAIKLEFKLKQHEKVTRLFFPLSSKIIIY